MIILNTKKSEKSLEAAKKIHLNRPQLLHQIMRSRRTTVIAGRATGKTRGITAFSLMDWALAMPRSVLRLACYTYEGLKMNVLPGIIQSWTEMGYVENVHFWVEKAPPAEYEIPKPVRPPGGNPKYMLFLLNGTVILFASVDRGRLNGGEHDAIAYEEVKFMERKDVKEMELAGRGNEGTFGHLYQHQSVLMVTDRPEVHDPGRWVLDESKKVTKELNKELLQTAFYLARLDSEIDLAAKNQDDKKLDKLHREYSRFGKFLNDLRKKSVNYIEASTLDNIHALGIDKIMDYYHNLDPYEYHVSVLNEDPGFVPNGFYSRYNPKEHGYRNINYSYIDNLDTVHKADIKRNSNWDNDTIFDDRLFIACDHNNAVNNVVTGQIMGDTAYFLSDLYVEDPDYVEALIDRWAEYYKDHKRKVVYYGYNHTSIKQDSQGNPTESETVIRKLREHEWDVIPVYLGKVPDHRTTHGLWSHTLNGEHPDMLRFRINLRACERLSKCLRSTDVIRSGNTFKKDKRSEKKDYKTNKYPVPQPYATHVTEAADALLLLMQREYYNGDIAPLISSFG